MGGGFRLGRQAMLDALKASLERLQTPSVDLYQVPMPCLTSHLHCTYSSCFNGAETHIPIEFC